MKIYISTKVENKLENIHAKFNRDLFEKLSPPLVGLKIERFDGCLKGDEIHLLLDTLGIRKTSWISIITTSEINAKEFYFIDEGLVLPPPLVYWKHVHRVEKIDDNNCFVIDNIEYKTKSLMMDKILYPALYSIFLYRCPIYKYELGV
jgi:ligand-binding SRPBCC domain-containing protein